MARVLLGICGGIAAYKAPQLVRDLLAVGHEVRVVMTESASHFVSALSLATVSQYPVRQSLFELNEEAEIGHIELARWPDCVLVAPATADLLARAAQGRCDDLLSTILLATRAQILVAPAMNVQMWAHPATLANVQCLRDRGVTVVGPQSGVLACGEQGIGKMAELSELVAAVQPAKAQDWAGQRVLVTAGPTREPLDAVRFISNPSTGTMGYALAQAAAERGAEVELISGPVALDCPEGVQRQMVQSGEQMYERCVQSLRAHPCDWVFKVAAVADLAFPGASEQKRDKAQWLSQPWNFAPTRDILESLVEDFGPVTRFLGFAAQTASGREPKAQLVAKAREKLQRKGCDAIFVNQIGPADSGFGPGSNRGYLLEREGEPRAVGEAKALPKLELAHTILDELKKVRPR